MMAVMSSCMDSKKGNTMQFEYSFYLNTFTSCGVNSSLPLMSMV